MPAGCLAGVTGTIPTEEKSNISLRLVSLGFRHIDAVSFVSPKHVPQMADSEAVMQELSQVKLPVRRGARHHRHRRQRTRPRTRACRRPALPRSAIHIRFPHIFGAPMRICRATNRARWSKNFSARRKPPAASLSSTFRWPSAIPTMSRGEPEIVEDALSG